jgi:hypothetical protein
MVGLSRNFQQRIYMEEYKGFCMDRRPIGLDTTYRIVLHRGIGILSHDDYS